MRGSILGAAMAAMGAFGAAAQAAPVDPWSGLLVFGDSLSDAGNTPLGTATNGQTWAGLSGALPFVDGGTNFAYLGAKAATDGDGVPDFAAQLSLFAANPRALGADPVAVAWFGGNDLRGDPGDGSTIVPALRAIAAGVGALAGTGLTRFVLPNLPDLSLIPENAARPPFVKALISRATAGFNAGLADLAGALRGSGLDVQVYDTAGLFADILADPGAFGFSTTLDLTATTCLRGAVSCDGILFWDGIHPTQAAHALVAAGISELAQPSPVPLPASVWLLAGGLAGLGAMGRRRRAAA